MQEESGIPSLPGRRVDAHKGEFGHTLILAGSPRMTGAALLATRGALRAGSGLVTLGVRLALDDFGTGYSSLAHLRDLPVDTVKIDRRFVHGMVTEAADRAIVETTVDLVRRLGRQVVAEGVESDEQIRMLLAMGCEVGQGYRFSVPLPAAVLSARLRRRDPTLLGRTTAPR